MVLNLQVFNYEGSMIGENYLERLGLRDKDSGIRFRDEDPTTIGGLGRACSSRV